MLRESICFHLVTSSNEHQSQQTPSILRPISILNIIHPRITDYSSEYDELFPLCHF
jgi:hypothetical protein